MGDYSFPVREAERLRAENLRMRGFGRRLIPVFIATGSLEVPFFGNRQHGPAVFFGVPPNCDFPFGFPRKSYPSTSDIIGWAEYETEFEDVSRAFGPSFENCF